ncbi:MAG: lysylphosphatidylglycerol synthase transmembrane domain-containing protein [Bacteroidota bacterium]|nr:lysylphosphatidylglycerol synthase transmembrane domain-containing protein [Bacteroidota bacterium]
MNKSARSILQLLIFLAIGALLVWLSLRQVAPQKDNVIKAFQSANYFWVIISLVIAVISHMLRAYRWNYLLNPLGHNVGFINANCHVLIGYFANYIPPRLGEVVRCTLAAKYDKVPFEVAFGTVITERIVDTFVFLVIFVFTLFLEFSNLIGLANKYVFDKLSPKLEGLYNNPVKLIIVIASLMIALSVFLFFRKKLANLLKGKFGSIIKGFGEGLGSIRKMERPVMFVILSFLIWTSYFYSLYFCFFAISGTSDLGQSEALTLLLFGTFGVIVSPGGIGAYQIILTGILIGTYHIDEISAFALPWLSWGSQFVMLVVLGVISLIVLPIINRNKNVVS